MGMEAAAVILKNPHDQVLLLLRGPTAPWMPNRWDLPGGMIEPGETPEAAALREVLEETGLIVRRLVPIAVVRSLAVFHSKRWEGQLSLNGEHSAFAWVPAKDLPKWDIVPTQRETLRLFARSRS